MNNKLLCFIIFLLISFDSLSNEAQRYDFCNVYTSDVCFGINKGDSIEMKMPAGFTLYTLTFGFDANAIIYYGYHPQKLPKVVLDIQQRKTTTGVSKAVKIAENKYRFLFKSTKSQKTIDVLVNLGNKRDANIILSFLENFKPCKRTGQSIECKDEGVFKGFGLN